MRLRGRRGIIACQWLKAIGATVIGTAGSEEKCALAKRYGAHHCINYRTENFVERVKEITKGAGLPVVYDSVGKDTFVGSLDCLRPFGLLASFGNSSGPVPPFEIGILAPRGSLYVTARHWGPMWRSVKISKRPRRSCSTSFSGKVKIEIEQRYALKDAAQAHRDLEARKTTGSTVLIP